MRALGFTTFHRRNLYPRGRQPGWIGKYGWTSAVTVSPATGAVGVSPTIDADSRLAAPDWSGGRLAHQLGYAWA